MLEDGDWYQDDDGRIFEYGFDKQKKVYRWFEIDYWICGIPEGREIKPPKPE